MSRYIIRRNASILRLALAIVFGLTFFIGLVLTMNIARIPDIALAQGFTTRYVAPTPTGNDSGNNCNNSSVPCATIQHAVDVAGLGDEIRVETGVYTNVQARAGVTQVVYISKTVIIRGGYTTNDWTTSNPVANPTTLDAQGQGRVLYITGAISPTIEGLRIMGGNAAGLGGGPFAEDFGGGVYVVSATVIMSNNQVFSNVAHARALGEVGSRGRGGGAFFYNSSKTILSHNVFSNNIASQGGGAYFYNSPMVTLISNTISNNKADHLGGGTKHYGGLFFSLSSNVTLISNTISGNYTANNCGGACFDRSDDAVLVGNTVISNIARQTGFAGNGAGLHVINSKNVNLLNNTISYNRGDGAINEGSLSGGGVYLGLNTTAVLTRNTINLNEATQGGGIYFDSSGTVTLSHNIIANNAAITGGGIYILKASPTLNSNQIISNATSSNGGGIFIDDGSSPTLTNNVIARNRADSNGAGIYIDFSTTKPTIINNTIVANNLGPSWANEAIFMSGSPSPTIVNNIIATHATGIEGTPLTITLDYNDVWACSRGCYSGVISGPHDKSFDPRFVNPGSDDYHLQGDSPLIDMGTNVGVPTTDFDDEPRLLDGNLDGMAITDIGADEFRPSKIFLPIILKNYDPRLVEVSGILHAGDACAFCCYPVLLETTSKFYELATFGMYQYDGLYVKIRGLLRNPCEVSSRQVISVISIEVLGSPP